MITFNYVSVLEVTLDLKLRDFHEVEVRCMKSEDDRTIHKFPSTFPPRET